MESISELLKPHAEIIAKVAGSITFLQLLSPVFMLNTIRRRGSSAGFPFLPFVGGFVLTLLSLKFASIIQDDAMIKVNLLGFGMNAIYASVYYFYTPSKDKMQVWAQIGVGGLFSICCILYCEYEDPKALEVRFGLLVTFLLVGLVGSPFLGIGDIIRNKSVGNMPLSIVASGTTVSLAWLAHGFAIGNSLVVGQNLLLGSMGAIQLFLYAIYPPKPEDQTEVKKKKKKQN